MQDIARLSIDIDSSSARKATSDLKEFSGAASATENSCFSLEKAVAAAAAAWATWQLGKQIQEATLLAARYETLGVVMNVMGTNAGKTSSEMAGLQAELQKTGISAIKSRESLNMLAAANVGLSKASELARVAQDAAVIAGMNSSDAFQNIVKSIQTGIVVTAHHMGLMVSYENAYKKMADTLHKTTGQLTEHEKTQARLNVMLEEGAKRAGVYEASMTTAGKQMKSMERYVEDLQTKLGALGGPAFTAIVTATVDSLKKLDKALEEAAKSGDIGVMQSNLKHGLMSLIDTVSSATKFLYEHKDAILAVGVVWAGIAIGAKAYEITMGIQAWIKTQRALAEQLILTRLLKEVDVKMNSQETMTTIAVTGATREKIRADLEAAAALQAKSMAQKGFASATTIAGEAVGGATATLSSMAGVIGIIIAVLSIASMAWIAFKKSATEGADQGLKAMRDHREELLRQIEAGSKYWELVGKGVDPKKAKADSVDSPELLPAVVRVTKDRQELEKQLAGMQSVYDRVKLLESQRASDKGWTMDKAQELAGLRGEADAYERLASKIEESKREQREYIDTVKTAARMKEGVEEHQIKVSEANRKKQEEEEQKRLKTGGTKRENTYERELGQINAFIAGLREANTLTEKVQAEVDKMIAEHENRATQWRKDAKGKNATLTSKQAEDLIERDLKAREDASRLAWKRMGEEQIRIDRETQAALRKSDSDTWAAKEALWQEEFNKINERRKKASLKEFSKDDESAFMANERHKALPGEVNRLKQALRELEEQKGRALTFGEQLAELDGLTVKLGSTELAAQKLAKELRNSELRKSNFWGGFKNGLEEVHSSMSDLFSAGSRMATDFANKGIDALTRFATTGKFLMKSFLAELATDIARFYMTKAVTQFIGAFLGGSSQQTPLYQGGYAAMYDFNIQGPKASGGDVPAGSTWLVGESGPEAFTAPANGRIIPNHALGSSNVDNSQLHLHFYEGNEQKRSGNGSQKNQDLAKVLYPMVRSIIIQEKRLGNTMNPLFAN